MPPTKQLVIRNFAQITEARIGLGDLTIVVGPQATGKSLALQWLKLAIDGNRVLGTLAEFGFDWSKDPKKLCSLVFGEGMETALRPETKVTFGAGEVSLARLAKGKRRTEPHEMFYVPAHRALTVSSGWPAQFRSAPPDAPFVVRAFGEELAQILGTGAGADRETLFPLDRRLKAEVRDAIDEAIFHGAKLELRTQGGGRRDLQLSHGQSTPLSYLGWTAGQREFVPLMLGLYYALPSGHRPRRDPLEWIVVEEPEMGLHPRGILSVMVLVFELLSRGYKVVLSTHSPLVLNVAWALRVLANRQRGAPTRVLEMFGLPSNNATLKLAKAALDARVTVTSLDFDPKHPRRVISKDISALDPASPDMVEAGWGGLTGYSARIADVISAAAVD